MPDSSAPPNTFDQSLLLKNSKPRLQGYGDVLSANKLLKDQQVRDAKGGQSLAADLFKEP